MSETSEATAEMPDLLADPRHICEATIREEEQNLAHVHVLRSRFALAATMGEKKA